MTKATHLYCLTAALVCLTFSLPVAAEEADAQPAKSEVTSSSEKQPPTKEEAVNTTTETSSATKTKEEPDCN